MVRSVKSRICKITLLIAPLSALILVAGCEITPAEPILQGKVEAENAGGGAMGAPGGMAGMGMAAAMSAPNAPDEPAAQQDAPENAPAAGGGRDLSGVATALGKSEADIRAALAAAGGPPPDLAAASQALGVSQQDLRTALQAARGNAAPAGMARPNGMTGPNAMTAPE